MIAWYHRQFVEVGDTVFKDELPPDYDSIEPQEPLKKPDEELKKLKLDDDDDDSEDEAPAKATGAEGLQTKLRENMVNYFTGELTLVVFIRFLQFLPQILPSFPFVRYLAEFCY